MPHQCLKCGQIFEQGSSQLLKGCPDCGGNRFFFTKEPIDAEKREEISKQVGKDVTEKIIDLLVENNKDIVDKSGKWVSIQPKEIRKLFESKISEKNGKTNENQKPDNELLVETKRKNLIQKIMNETQKPGIPQTIDIERPGKYVIDLKGLLEKEPIVIQKDGTYTIHLPSVFKMIEREQN